MIFVIELKENEKHSFTKKENITIQYIYAKSEFHGILNLEFKQLNKESIIIGSIDNNNKNIELDIELSVDNGDSLVLNGTNLNSSGIISIFAKYNNNNNNLNNKKIEKFSYKVNEEEEENKINDEEKKNIVSNIKKTEENISSNEEESKKYETFLNLNENDEINDQNNKYLDNHDVIITDINFINSTNLNEKEKEIQFFLEEYLNNCNKIQHKVKFETHDFNGKIYLKKPLNRNITWQDLDNNIVNNPITSKRRHHNSVWGVPGCGKTFVLKNYPLYSCIRNDTLFSYITMNDGSNFNKNKEINADLIILSRIIYDFLKKCNIEIKFKTILEKILFKEWEIDNVISYLIKITNKKNFFISIDEISKISIDKLRIETIGKVANLLDENNFFYALISTLNLSLTDAFSTESNRLVKYTVLPALTEFLCYYEENEILKELNFYKNQYLLLCAYDLCSLPKRLNEFINYLFENKTELENLNMEYKLVEGRINFILMQSITFAEIHTKLIKSCLEYKFKEGRIPNKSACIYDNIRFYEVYALGIFICDNLDGYPILNPHVIKSIIKNNNVEILDYFPMNELNLILNTRIFSNINENNSKKDDNNSNLSLSFEYFTLHIDIFLRKYIYYGKIFPDKDSFEKKSVKYEDIFLKSFSINESIHFSLHKNYHINDNYISKNYSELKSSVIDYLEEKEFDQLLEGTCYIINISNGQGFDKFKVDYEVNTKEYYFTFFQDKRSTQEKEKSVFKQKKFINTLKNIDKEMKKLSKFTETRTNIKFSSVPFVVFYAYYDLETNYNVNDFKTWKIIIIGKESLNHRFTGLLETRLEFWNTYCRNEKEKGKRIIEESINK